MFRIRCFDRAFGTLALISADSTPARTPGKLLGDQKPLPQDAKAQRHCRRRLRRSTAGTRPGAADPKACSGIMDDQARLKCFDGIFPGPAAEAMWLNPPIDPPILVRRVQTQRITADAPPAREPGSVLRAIDRDAVSGG
jgi:hypothetical protein